MYYAQDDAVVSFEWGEAAIGHLAPGCDAVVVVDVLSFSTAVDVALGRGATVLPSRWDTDAAALARERGALLASRRRGEGYSLSPASLSTLPAGTRLVLPSPNGATLSEMAGRHGATVLTACFRNAPAVAQFLQSRFRRILVVAAGERWPDGTLRPAAEDLWGAGAVIAALGRPTSAEAQMAADAYRAVQDELPRALERCSSGRELRERGFGADLAWAGDSGASCVVPVLHQGEYRRG